VVVLDWISFGFFLTGTADPSTVYALGALRSTRLVRLVRLVDLGKFISSYMALNFRSEMMSTVFGVVKILLFLYGVAHLCACGWYGIGSLEGSSWTASLDVRSQSLWHRYVTSLHWSLAMISGSTIINPENTIERTYAAFTQVAAFLASVYMVSDLTTLMTQLQLASANHKRQVVTLERFLSDHCIPTRLAARITENASNSVKSMAQTPPEHTVELLKFISGALLMELHFAMNAPFLTLHPFFVSYKLANPSGMRDICHSAVTAETLSRGDVIFSIGEVSNNPRVIFICNGTLSYLMPNSRPRQLEEGLVVNEAVLWIASWQQLGAMSASEAAEIVCMDIGPCVEAFLKFRTKNFYPAAYARNFVSELNLASVTDVTDISSDFIDLELATERVFGTAFGRSSATGTSRRGSLMF